jgi:hypothetical protein
VDGVEEALQTRRFPLPPLQHGATVAPEN